MNGLYILIASVVVGTFAGVIAYLITYNEYQHHFKGRRVVIESLKSAAVAFFFFLCLTVILCLILAFKETPVPSPGRSSRLNNCLTFLNLPASASTNPVG
jgi:hypothetical protein